MQIPHHCTLCPRACGADRAAGQRGFCGADNTLRVARAALHHWEEPCLSGDPNAETGSGTVFFSGRTLKCCYCQNYPISQGEVGKAISVERLTEIFMNLQNGGAKNLNLVTASQYLPWVTAALDAARAQGFSLPVVYNTGGYETVDAVRALAGYVDIWLADYKYADGALAAELSAARDYPAVADAATAADAFADRRTGVRRGRVFAEGRHCAASGPARPRGRQQGRAAAAGSAAGGNRHRIYPQLNEPVYTLL
ncbi:MAG: radical SAM protein [Gemmiger formicilis]